MYSADFPERVLNDRAYPWCAAGKHASSPYQSAQDRDQDRRPTRSRAAAVKATAPRDGYGLAEVGAEDMAAVAGSGSIGRKADGSSGDRRDPVQVVLIAICGIIFAWMAADFFYNLGRQDDFKPSLFASEFKDLPPIWRGVR